MKSFKIFVCLMVICFSFQYSFGRHLQSDLCIESELKVSTISGLVVLSNQTIIDDLVINLKDRSSKERLIAETKTDDNGEFSFANVRSGKYLIVIEGENFVPLTIPIRLKKTSSKKLQTGLKITMALLIPGECSKAETKIYK